MPYAQNFTQVLPDLTRTFLLKADTVAWASEQELAVYRGEVINRSLAEKTNLGELFLRYMEQISSGVGWRPRYGLRGSPDEPG